jgi:hypothetical protein
MQLHGMHMDLGAAGEGLLFEHFLLDDGAHSALHLLALRGGGVAHCLVLDGRHHTHYQLTMAARATESTEYNCAWHNSLSSSYAWQNSFLHMCLS